MFVFTYEDFVLFSCNNNFLLILTFEAYKLLLLIWSSLVVKEKNGFPEIDNNIMK